MAGEIKIFTMNDCDWMAAASLEEAVAEYKATYGTEIEDPRELTDAELDGKTFHDTDDNDQTFAVRSFREQLAKMVADGDKFPTFFGSTEF